MYVYTCVCAPCELSWNQLIPTGMILCVYVPKYKVGQEEYVECWFISANSGQVRS